MISNCACWEDVHLSRDNQVKKSSLNLCICLVYVHNAILTSYSYVYNDDIYITQDETETTYVDSRQTIVPLVLPTQLDSEDSDSDSEDGSKDDPVQGLDQKQESYDEDVYGDKAIDSCKGNKVGNYEARLGVSTDYTVILVFVLEI
jgi:hypothetical protein